jgi:hypothetical protein
MQSNKHLNNFERGYITALRDEGMSFYAVRRKFLQVFNRKLSLRTVYTSRHPVKIRKPRRRKLKRKSLKKPNAD